MWEERAPIDSADLLQMGLRPPRCNGCKIAQLKWGLGDKFLGLLSEDGWYAVYALDQLPSLDQRKVEHEGRPVRFVAMFMSPEHSDECYHWEAPA